MTFLLLAVLIIAAVITLCIYLLVRGHNERRNAGYDWFEGKR